MAKKQSGSKKAGPKKKRSAQPQVSQQAIQPAGTSMYALRETIESIVIAFVLAFLFRTFEAEAFVIPTGSMSPSLQGQHKDCECSECGYRFRASASSEGDQKLQALAKGNRQAALDFDVVAGMCPMCRQTMAIGPTKPTYAPSFVDVENFESQTTYPGDRILVNKYDYNHRDPDRWDVVVFKFPGDGEMNYIKRLVGLPNETLRVYQGDIFIRDDEGGTDFEIARKPADKVLAMLQPVHDTDYDSASLYQAGWPLRWETQGGWEVDAKVDGKTVTQTFRSEDSDSSDETAWLRYRHYIPSDNDWLLARDRNQNEQDQAAWPNEVRPSLISDFNPYNAFLIRGETDSKGWSITSHSNRLGNEWVSDLALRCEVEVLEASGSLILDLVEADRHFSCELNLADGTATLAIEGADQFSATATTAVKSTGSYELLFANVDDQLLLWIDGELVEFADNTYGEQETGPREGLIPVADSTDLGDLAPAGIGVQGAKVIVDRLEVLRDIYYIATNHADYVQHADYLWRGEDLLEDGSSLTPLRKPRDLFQDPETWSRFATRRKRDFQIKDGQLFVMGDNSPASLDCRLWTPPQKGKFSHPGGPYLDRRLLIGKAVCVFWPHSWGGIGPLPGFPNFGDMRLVR